MSRSPSSLRSSLAPAPLRSPLPGTTRNEVHSPPSYGDHLHSPVIATSFSQQRDSGRPYISAPIPSEERAFGDLKSDGRPASLRREDDERRQAEDGLAPYLGLRARMFLSLFSAPLVALVFTATHLFISSSSIDSSVTSAKESLLEVCQAAEKQASTVASLPHWTAAAMNQRTSETVVNTVQGVGKVLTLAVTAIENLLVFLVDAYRSLFACFIELLVRGALALLIAAVKLLNTAVEDVASAIAATIKGSIDVVNTFLSTSITALNDVLAVIGQSITVPVVAQPDLSALSNVTLPSSFESALLSLNSSLPTLDALRTEVNALIETPFESLKADVNSTIGNFTFDSSLLPVPAKQTVTFCDQLDTSSLDDFGQALQKLLYILLGILAAAVLVCLAFQLAKAWYAWRCLNQHLERIQSAWQDIDPRMSNEGHGRFDGDASPLSSFLSKSHLFTLLSLSQHPLLSSFSFRASDKLGMKSVRAQNHLRWCLAFVSHPMAVAILALGLSGFAATQVQLWALNPVQEQFQSSFDLSLTTFADGAIAQVNNLTTLASQDYANRTNALIIAAQDEINDHLFAWVNTTAGTMNSSINALQSGLSEAMKSTFASTPLYDSVSTFLQCAIFNKLEAVEEALDWISRNAEVTFAIVPLDVLALSSDNSRELADVIIGGSDGNSGGAAILSKISNEYRDKLEVERIMFAVLLALYGFLVLVGVLVAALAGQEHRWQSSSASAPRKWAQDMEEKEAVAQGGSYARSANEAYRGQEKSEDGGELDRRSHYSISSPASRHFSPAEDYDLSEDQRQMHRAL